MVSEAFCNRDLTQSVCPDQIIPAIMEVKGCSKLETADISVRILELFEMGETSIAVFRHHVPLHIIFSTKGFFADRTEPTHVNSSGAKCRLRIS